MALRPSDIESLPLFSGIPNDHLIDLIQAFERLSVPPGQTLFEAGTAPAHLFLLERGEVTLREPNGREPRFRVGPIAILGELGAVTALSHNTTAETTRESDLYRIGVAELARFFEARSEIAFPFYHNLLNLVADKVRRESHRIEEMRSNLVRTQKAMKRLLDRVLEAEESPLSKEICESLEELIEHNRRSHYLVVPARVLPSHVRLDTGSVVPVVELSDGLLRIPGAAQVPGVSSRWSGVLVTSSGEIPVSGTVISDDPNGALIKLDSLIDAYSDILRDYLTRVQLHDFVV
jgi:CRP-like cAMP-binding protein